MSFKDHFSGHAAEYARFRPVYPAALFAYLASLAPEHNRAWDCATGNGQAARGLAHHFQLVTATDASAEQIAKAEPHERVEYRIAPAEKSGLDASSIDLVTVAQALHWFDITAFLGEVQRVLKPRGIVAVWAYNLLTICPPVDRLVQEFYAETTGPYWPPERALVESGYSALAFPFEELAPPAFEMEAHWRLEQLLGYLRTWSATQKFVAARGFDPVDALGERMRESWGERGEERLVRWPLTLRVGRTE
ncbi:MAG TPA: class I SAM-dependent methyltransferase [Chthoniobacterales bacterium]|nr:class I SAM-dependent methyltransferase [Chthoniobacterales bacterium]